MGRGVCLIASRRDVYLLLSAESLRLREEHLRALVGHELGHLAQGDLRLSRSLRIVFDAISQVLWLSLVSYLVLEILCNWVFYWSVMPLTSLLIIPFVSMVVVAFGTFPLVVSYLMLRWFVVRTLHGAEFISDMHAVAVAGSSTFIEVLNELVPQGASFFHGWSTHPTLEQRIARVRTA